MQFKDLADYIAGKACEGADVDGFMSFSMNELQGHSFEWLSEITDIERDFEFSA